MAFTAKIADLIADDKTGLLAKHESWERVPLHEVASILNGAPFDSAKFNTSSGVPLARIRDVSGGETSTYYTGEYENTYLLSQGDLLVGMDGDFNIGYWRKQPALLNQRVCKLTPNSEIYDKALLGYVLPGYLAVINANTPSITVKHLSSKTVGEIELPLPPRAEQTRIVEKLEELLSDLDAGVAELKAAQRKLTRYRQSLLKAAVEGTLTADWRATHSPTETGAQLLQRILAERRSRWEDKQRAKFAAQGKAPPEGWQAKYSEPAAPDLTTLPSLPNGWVWATLDQLVAESSYGTSVKCSYEKMGDPVVRIPNVGSGKIDLTDIKFATENLRLKNDDYLSTGDVLVIRTNGSIRLVGRAAFISTPLRSSHYFASYLLRLRCVEATTSHRWIHSVLASPAARRWIESKAASSAGQHNISLSTLLTMPVPIPSLAEQEATLEATDIVSDAADYQECALKKSLVQVSAQRKNILTAAFSGQLVPQDPNDEPASVLLERIRATRAQQPKATRRGRAAGSKPAPATKSPAKRSRKTGASP